MARPRGWGAPKARPPGRTAGPPTSGPRDGEVVAFFPMLLRTPTRDGFIVGTGAPAEEVPAAAARLFELRTPVFLVRAVQARPPTRPSFLIAVLALDAATSLAVVAPSTGPTATVAAQGPFHLIGIIMPSRLKDGEEEGHNFIFCPSGVGVSATARGCATEESGKQM